MPLWVSSVRLATYSLFTPSGRTLPKGKKENENTKKKRIGFLHPLQPTMSKHKSPQGYVKPNILLVNPLLGSPITNKGLFIMDCRSNPL